MGRRGRGGSWTSSWTGCGRLPKGRAVERQGQEARIAELIATSPHFARLWEAREVVEFRSSVRRYRHPNAGDIEVSFVRLAGAGGALVEPGLSLPGAGQRVGEAAARAGYPS
ncbi:hypothetical protein [Streptomyces sp. NBC_00986]|uniref:MmyB family transcriptional regulator n=1 Tax=Streptomyces sp. NBC_00986 TaxID=2903702 RepID=UPI00386C533A